MIFVFGTILQLIRVETDESQVYEQFEFAKNYKNSVGGKGALQALAAARAGAKTAIVGKTGDDELAKHILLRLRKHGVITSGVAKAEKIQTGTSIRLEHEDRTIIALGANTNASHEQIPEDVLSDRHIVLLQTELGQEENSKILATAKEKGATTILNASPRFRIPDDDISNIDYVIASSRHKEKWVRIIDPESMQKLTTVFISPDGTVELYMKGAITPLPQIKTDKLHWKYPEGYEDTFCGTFAAGLYAKLPLDKVLLRAYIAAAITASQPGGYDTIPYSDAVNEQVKTLEES